MSNSQESVGTWLVDLVMKPGTSVQLVSLGLSYLVTLSIIIYIVFIQLRAECPTSKLPSTFRLSSSLC